MDVLDTLGRPLRDLRISVTDRCNFRCIYCMPKEVFGRDYRFLDRRELLTFEEITRVAGIFVALGDAQDPDHRRRAARAARPRAAGRAARGARRRPDADDERLAPAAQGASCSRTPACERVTVSLDALDDATFRALNDVDFPVERVLEGIDAAVAAGLPVKVNAVVKRGVNDDQIVPMAAFFQERGQTLRFIEYMDVGHTNGWRLDDVVPAAEIVATLDAAFGVEPVEPSYRGEVAKRWRYRDGSGEVGVIASVTQPFCGDCTRARLSAEGKLYTCLFAVRGTRPARTRPRRRDRRRARRSAARHLARPRGPVLGAPLRSDRRPPEGGDELHRRLTPARTGFRPRRATSGAGLESASHVRGGRSGPPASAARLVRSRSPARDLVRLRRALPGGAWHRRPEAAFGGVRARPRGRRSRDALHAPAVRADVAELRRPAPPARDRRLVDVLELGVHRRRARACSSSTCAGTRRSSSFRNSILLANVIGLSGTSSCRPLRRACSASGSSTRTATASSVSPRTRTPRCRASTPPTR